MSDRLESLLERRLPQKIVELPALLAPKPPVKWYSRSTGGFYSSDIHSTEQLPADAVVITSERWQELLDTQAEGHEIGPDSAGNPISAPPDAQARATRLRTKRNLLLARTDGLVARHRDELEAAGDSGVYIVHPTTLSADTYRDLRNYRQALRNLPSTPGFPDVDLPPIPDELEGVLRT